MRSYLKALAARKPCILGGDLNCSFLDIDLHEPYMKGAHLLRGHTPEERRAFAQLLQETGFRDSLRHFYPGARAVEL
jgi:AP endonuclease-1